MQDGKAIPYSEGAVVGTMSAYEVDFRVGLNIGDATSHSVGFGPYGGVRYVQLGVLDLEDVSKAVCNLVGAGISPPS